MKHRRRIEGQQGSAFLASSRHPFQLFLLVLSIVSGIPLLLGIERGPATIESLLPDGMVYMWGLLLTVGSATALIGSLMSNRINGILVEQWGLLVVAVTTIFYGVGILLVVGRTGIQPAAIILAFGLACAYRWYELQRYIGSLSRIVSDVAETTLKDEETVRAVAEQENPDPDRDANRSFGHEDED